jgi:hypothetical protein
MEQLCTPFQTDPNDADMKNKLKFFTVRIALWPGLTVHFADKELNSGHCCGIMLELRLNITKSKILHSHKNNGNTKYKAFISNSAVSINL